jgi:hypothetical protein
MFPWKMLDLKINELIVPGGVMSSDSLRKNSKASEFLKEFLWRVRL